MSKSNTFENDLLLLIFNNTDITLIGDAAGLQNSAAAGSLYVSLHTSDPGEAGDQTTNETAYTDYARVAVARSGAGWTVTGNAVANAALVQFPQCGVTGATLTHFGVGTVIIGLCKPLWMIPVPATGLYNKVDFVNALPSMRKIPDGANIQFLLFQTGATTSAGTINVDFDYAYGGS